MFIWAGRAIGRSSREDKRSYCLPTGLTVALFSLTGLNTILRFFDFATGRGSFFGCNRYPGDGLEMLMRR